MIWVQVIGHKCTSERIDRAPMSQYLSVLEESVEADSVSSQRRMQQRTAESLEE